MADLKSIFVEVDGKIHNGLYKEENSRVTVVHDGRTTTHDNGRMPAGTLARKMLREIVAGNLD